jgi:uncharacterized membrane protein
MLPDPLHPALVHFPIVLALLAPVIAIALLLAIRAGRLPARAWLGVVVLQAIIVGVGWGTAESGENEEDRVERIIREDPIEEHEEAAERFLWIAGLALPLAAAGLARGGVGSGGRVLTVVALVVAAAAVGQVGHSGGELVYRHGAANAYLDAATSARTLQARSGGDTGLNEPHDD